MMPNQINLRTIALRKKERPLTAPPSLEYAQLIAQRRACRVAENRQMEQSNNHFSNLKNSIELENAFQERQQVESHLRLGNVPAHIAHPIAAAMMAPVAMEVARRRLTWTWGERPIAPVDPVEASRWSQRTRLNCCGSWSQNLT